MIVFLDPFSDFGLLAADVDRDFPFSPCTVSLDAELRRDRTAASPESFEPFWETVDGVLRSTAVELAEERRRLRGGECKGEWEPSRSFS